MGSSADRNDADRDGLTDLQEQILGTSPYAADSDGDGFSDLEERTRNSNPLASASEPEPAHHGLGMCASQEDGFVSILSSIYLPDGDLDAVTYEMGVVYNNRIVRLNSSVRDYTRAFIRRGADRADRIAVLEVGLPETLVRRLGQLTVYSIVRGADAANSEPVVSMVNLRSVGNIVESIEPIGSRYSTSNTAEATVAGVVYRPLVDSGRVPSTWSSGQVCFQQTSAVGMQGVSVVHEVSGADCIPMDSSCSAGDCGSGVGRPMRIPDPLALAGG